MEQELVRAFMESFQVNALIDSDSAHSTALTKALSEFPGRDPSLPTTATVFAGILPSRLLFGFVPLLLPHTTCRFFLPFLLLLHFFSPFGSFSLPSLIWALSQPTVWLGPTQPHWWHLLAPVLWLCWKLGQASSWASNLRRERKNNTLELEVPFLQRCDGIVLSFKKVFVCSLLRKSRRTPLLGRCVLLP